MSVERQVYRRREQLGTRVRDIEGDRDCVVDSIRIDGLYASRITASRKVRLVSGHHESCGRSGGRGTYAQPGRSRGIGLSAIHNNLEIVWEKRALGGSNTDGLGWRRITADRCGES